MLLAHKPNITLKNCKGQTAIDITKSKTIISMFWHYLTGNIEEDTVKIKQLIPNKKASEKNLKKVFKFN